MKGIKLFLSLLIAISLSSCMSEDGSKVKSGVVGGLTGAGFGAGVGAIAGHAAGKTGAGVAIGAGSGAVLGIVAGIMIQSYREKKEIERNNEIIKANYTYITSRQREIEMAREALIEDSLNIVPNKELRGEIYTGPTIGTYNR